MKKKEKIEILEYQNEYLKRYLINSNNERIELELTIVQLKEENKELNRKLKILLDEI